MEKWEQLSLFDYAEEQYRKMVADTVEVKEV